MNLDDMKKAWNADPGKDIVIPTAVDQLKSVGMPVEKIRKMMFAESFIQIAAVILMYFSPLFFSIEAKYLQSFYYLYVVFVMICIYYFLKFYFFYKRLNQPTLNSRDNLYALYYDIRLNVEMYKTFTYTISPFILVYAYMYLSNRFSFERLNFHQLFIYELIMIGILSILFTIIFTEYWLKTSYGKYAAEVKAVLDELKEES